MFQYSPMVDLEKYRSYLQLIAEMQTADGLRGKIDVSGVVQQTIWEGTCQLGNERSRSDEQLAALLRRILMRNLTDEIRRVCAIKRDARREQPLHADAEQSAAKIIQLIDHSHTSPSQNMIRFERVLRVSEELEKLPQDERLALVGRYLRDQSLSEIAESMNRTKPAIAGLLQRGLRRLRIRMADDPSHY